MEKITLKRPIVVTATSPATEKGYEVLAKAVLIEDRGAPLYAMYRAYTVAKDGSVATHETGTFGVSQDEFRQQQPNTPAGWQAANRHFWSLGNRVPVYITIPDSNIDGVEHHD